MKINYFICFWLVVLILIGSLSTCYSGESAIKFVLFTPQISFSKDYKEQFKDAMDVICNDFARSLQSSKAIECSVDVNSSDTLTECIKKGFGRKLESDLATLFKKYPSYEYFIVWRIYNSMGIVEIKGKVYGVKKGSSFELSTEGDEQTVNTSVPKNGLRSILLEEYLIQQLVAQVEAHIDTKIRVFVSPFRLSGNDSTIKYLGDAIANRIQTRINQSEHIRVIRGTAAIPESLLATIGPHWEIREWTLPGRWKREAPKYLVTGSFAKVGRVLSLTAEDIDLETGHAVVSHSIIVDSLDGLVLFQRADQLGDRLRSGIELDYSSKHDTLKRIGIVAAVPYPVTGFNIAIAKNVARGIRDVLQLEKEKNALFQICYEPQKIDKFIDGEVDEVDQTRELSSHYLLSIGIDRPLPDFVLNLSLLDFRYPSNPIYKQSFQVKDIDNLYSHIGKYTNEFLEKCWAKTKCKYQKPDTVVKSQMEKYRLKDETWGIRARGMIMGFLDNSAEVFLGNEFRYGIELSWIHYSIPWQFELTTCYDFGKTAGQYHAYGRYFNIGARYNFLELNLLRDMRLYTGAGIGGVNVVRVSGAGASSRLVFSLAFSAGAELLSLRKMYLDINGGLHIPFADVRGFSYYGDPVEGNITSFSIGIGIGCRF